MRNGGYVAMKPCRVCRKFYRPHVRVGDRQKTCTQEACRKAWRSRKNKEAYRKERGYHRDHALRKKLEHEREKPRAEKPGEGVANPGTRQESSLQLPREEIREAMSEEAVVILEYLVTMIFRRARAYTFL